MYLNQKQTNTTHQLGNVQAAPVERIPLWLVEAVEEEGSGDEEEGAGKEDEEDVMEAGRERGVGETGEIGVLLRRSRCWSLFLLSFK